MLPTMAIFRVLLLSLALLVTSLAQADDTFGGLGNPTATVVGAHGTQYIWQPGNGATIILPFEQGATLGVDAFNVQNQYPGMVIAHHGFDPKMSAILQPHVNSGQMQNGLFVLSCPYGAPCGSGPGAPYARQYGCTAMSAMSQTGREVVFLEQGFNSDTGEPVSILKVTTVGKKPLLPFRNPEPDRLLPLGQSYGDFNPDGSVRPIPNPEERFGPGVLVVGSDGGKFGTGVGRAARPQVPMSGMGCMSTLRNAPRSFGRSFVGSGGLDPEFVFTASSQLAHEMGASDGVSVGVGGLTAGAAASYAAYQASGLAAAGVSFSSYLEMMAIGAVPSAGALALGGAATAAVAGVGFAGVGVYGVITHSPEMGYVPEGGYSTGYIDNFKDLYGGLCFWCD